MNHQKRNQEIQRVKQIRRYHEQETNLKFHQLKWTKRALDFKTYNWYQESIKMDPLFLQVFKFKPDISMFKERRIFGILGFALVLHWHLIFNKIYWEDFWIREPGKQPMQERFWYFILYRFTRSKLIGYYDYKEIEREHTLTLYRMNQWINYQKLKDKRFNFLSLAEKEELEELQISMKN